MSYHKIERNMLKKVTPDFIQMRTDVTNDMNLNKQSTRQQHFDKNYKKQ